MATNMLEDAFKLLLGEIGRCLEPHGYRKRGTAFRHLSSNNAAIIEVQRSQNSARDLIRLTINVGVVSGRLLDEDRLNIAKAGTADAHLRDRIGRFLAEPQDKWWDLDKATRLEELVAELAPLLDLAVAFLNAHLDDAQLVTLWESGKAPGLTEPQRQRLLRELKAN